MPLKRLVLFVLMLSVLLCAACTPSASTEEERGEPAASVPPSEVVVSPPPSGLPTPELPPMPTATAPELPSGPIWDAEHHLDVELTQIKAGRLELPIYGATGYTTVTLPLWAEIPPPPSPAIAQSEVTVQNEAIFVPTSESAPPAEASPLESHAIPSETDSSMEMPPVPTETPVPLPTDTIGAELIPNEPSPSVLPSPSIAPTPTPDPFAGAMAVLPAGTPFIILEEHGDWWWIKSSAGKGWIAHSYCMINLPDVIPSIVYDATNGYQSLYTTSGLPLPDITGKALYTGKIYNSRFDEEQFLMPVLYEMAKKLCQAQQNALAEGNSIKLYEGYRPYQVQKAVYKAITDMSKTNPVVKQGVETGNWKPFWFIASGYSNHQRGYAIDVSLVKVTVASYESISEHTYLKVSSFEEYEMPTQIHELSVAAATFTEPVDSYSQTAWKKAILSPGMNSPALGLQRYCTDAGLVPLASEWWHFNDIQAWSKSKDNPGTGGFEIKQVLSLKP